MNIGDKVRHLRGNEEGIVTRIISMVEVEVEIEDGFRIPFAKSDLVLVSKQEAEYFRKTTEKKAPEPKKKDTLVKPVMSETGVFVAFIPFNDQQLEVYLINNTDLNLPFIFGEEENHIFTGIAAGGVGARTGKKVSEMNLAKFENWPTLIVQALFYHQGTYTLKDPLTKRMKFKATTFFKQKGLAPILLKEAYLFQLDGDWKPVSAEEIKIAITEPKAAPLPPPAAVMPMRPTQKHIDVDLHIEELLPNATNMKPENMLAFQLQVFEQKLDEAILAGVSEVTFIHGVGNGVLRGEIQKRLSKHPHIEFFKDAQKEKFGYGATTAKIK